MHATGIVATGAHCTAKPRPSGRRFPGGADAGDRSRHDRVSGQLPRKPFLTGPNCWEGTRDVLEDFRAAGKSQTLVPRLCPSAGGAFRSAAYRRTVSSRGRISQKLGGEPPEGRLRPGLAAPHFGPV